MMQTEAAYRNLREPKSENSAPALGLELLTIQEPRRTIPESALHLDLNALYKAGMLAKFLDAEGVERYQPIGGEL